MCTILDRLISNLHFSQTMNEYFAIDEKIEPAKQVLTEAVKQGPNLGKLLRGGSFASCAQVYRHLASDFDTDSAYKNERTDPRPVSRRARRTSRNRTQRNNVSRRYPLGLCWGFQEARGCSFGDECNFKHECSGCNNPNHGYHACHSQSGGQ